MSNARVPKCATARALASVVLCRLLQLHLAAGGVHPSSMTRSELIEAGVPIRARGLSRRDTTQRKDRVRAALRAHRAAVEGKPTAEIKGRFCVKQTTSINTQTHKYIHKQIHKYASAINQ